MILLSFWNDWNRVFGYCQFFDEWPTVLELVQLVHFEWFSFLLLNICVGWGWIGNLVGVPSLR